MKSRYRLILVIFLMLISLATSPLYCHQDNGKERKLVYLAADVLLSIDITKCTSWNSNTTSSYQVPVTENAEL